MIARFGVRLLLALVFALCGACSSFDARWHSAATSGTASRWEGRWTSEKHLAPGGGPGGGRLRAIIEPAPDAGLTAHFRANWLVFASDYAMNFRPDATARLRGSPVRKYRGTHELPKIFGGTYRYEASLEGDRFAARYDSSYDRGTFALQRVPAQKDSSAAHARH